MGNYARIWTERWSWKSAVSRLRNIQYPTAIHLRKTRDEGPLQKHIFELEEAILKHHIG